jgi:hypothetical protein
VQVKVLVEEQHVLGNDDIGDDMVQERQALPLGRKSPWRIGAPDCSRRDKVRPEIFIMYTVANWMVVVPTYEFTSIGP